jgi:predicted DNA-binding ribbon-helix-helix protein
LTGDPPSGGARSVIRKRSVTIAGHKTSLSLEQAFWDELKRLADADGLSVNALVAAIDEAAPGNLSSAIRLYVLDRLRREAGRES